MSLSPFDDLPIHQIPEPIRRVGTSDLNFYDRYYFNMHGLHDDVCLIAGLGVYPNLGVCDGFALYVDGDTHLVVRASRELGPDRSDTAVGPFRVEVLEGLRRLRITLDPNEWELEFDLVFEGAMPAHEEPRHFMRRAERVLFDTSRLAQTGRWSGNLRAGGRDHVVTPERWWGCRDRSWGVRQLNPPSLPTAPDKEPFSMFWNYAQIQFTDHSIIYMVHEERSGARILEESVRVWHDADRPVERLGSPRHELEFTPGTRTVTGGVLDLGSGADGRPVTLTLTPGLAVHLGVGTGYGNEPDWRHGMYQGPLKVDGRRLDLRDPGVRGGLGGLVDAVATYEYGGQQGIGLWEYSIRGPHDRYGLRGVSGGFGEVDA